MANPHGLSDKLFDRLVSCVYDVRQELVSYELQHATNQARRNELGIHWTSFSFQELVDYGYVAYDGPFARLEKAGEKFLFSVAGIPPMPRKDLLDTNFDLKAQVEASLKIDPTAFGSTFRVLPMGSLQGDDPVAVQYNGLNQPRGGELPALAQAGIDLLALGGYAVAFVPKEGFSEAALYVYSRPDKAARTDITLQDAIGRLTN